MQPPTLQPALPALSANERDILLTLFDLGRKIASVIDLDELLPRIPELVGRLIQFDAFAVDLALSAGVLGQVVATQQPQVIGDVALDPSYVSVVPDMHATLAVPLIHKS